MPNALIVRMLRCCISVHVESRPFCLVEPLRGRTFVLVGLIMMQCTLLNPAVLVGCGQ